MTFALDRIVELASQGPVARVVVADTRGSVPREVGAAMLVSATACEGTIGGGTLEFQAIDRARGALATGADKFDVQPLGPSLGQCCGGSVSVLIEIWDEARLAKVSGNLVARPLPGNSKDMPLIVKRLLTDARAGQSDKLPVLCEGWMVERVSRPARDVWVWGAGHVGRAIVSVLADLPDFEIHWVDCGVDRFPDVVHEGVTSLIAENPADLVTLASHHSEHLVLTYSHALDLEICHRVLRRSFASLGLIGSQTKRARFRSRLAALGHAPEQVDRMVCPIGDPVLGKHPQAIAIGVAASLLAEAKIAGEMEKTA